MYIIQPLKITEDKSEKYNNFFLRCNLTVSMLH